MTETTDFPRIDLSKSRYSQEHWTGRFRHFLDVTDFRTCLTSDEALARATRLIEDYQNSRPISPPPTEEQLWRAKKLRDAMVHPDTGEKIFLPFRLSFFTPMNMLIAWGLLIPNASIPVQVFWQWFNQSYNVCVNHANRNASNLMSSSQVLQGYFGATAVSCSVVAGITVLVRRAHFLPPRALSLLTFIAPFTAAGSAGAFNVFLMRHNEITEGVDVYDEEGRMLGKSKVAGSEAVAKTAVSRVATSFPILIVPPLIVNAVKNYTSFLTRFPRLYQPLNISVITLVLMTALPAAVALFPQTLVRKASDLEPEFHSPDPNRPIHFSRGL
eukprot:TRINITY_DN5754_c0_g1_i1.p1 TRINITY_DN5754_c0_g1~~TRINITY_DN5754_c0_g1_i1.p1  ORF type:complete len:354 (-),score=142.19 TRINITY_DN5754_c0_g1_i1:133-1116(-)